MTDASFAELEIGEQGEHVIELQTRLKELGHDVPETGIFDEQTQTVLTEFAANQGVADGSTATAVNQLQAVTGELQSTEWTARYTAAVGSTYKDEDQPGNTVWAKETGDRKQTYIPSDAEAARDEFGYDIKGGKLGSEGELLDTTDIGTKARFVGSKPERMIFTMDTEGQLNLADPRAEEATRPGMRVHHSTLGGKEEVAGAGEMKVREGVIEQVSDTSGHYRPDFAMTQQVGEALKKQGVDTDKVTFELGNYKSDDTRLKDTLASGTEILSYNREAILNELNPILRKRADEAGKRKWGGAWDMLPAEVREREMDELFAKLAKPYAEMNERDLQQEGRKILQGRHEALDSVLAEIKLGRGWKDDPTGRHSLRFYDGTMWTKRVLDGDKESTDQIGVMLLEKGGGESEAPSSWPSEAPASGGSPPTAVDGGYPPDAPAPRTVDGGYPPAAPAPRTVDGGYPPHPPKAVDGGYAPDPPNPGTSSGGGTTN